MRQVLSSMCIARRKGANQGAVLAEFALILPLLAILLMVVIDLGLLVREHQVLQNAAREGARFSALPRNWIDSRNPGASADLIKQRVVQYLQEERIVVSTASITVNQRYPINIGSTTAYASEIVVRYPRSLLIPGGPLLPSGQIELAGRAVFRNLY